MAAEKEGEAVATAQEGRLLILMPVVVYIGYNRVLLTAPR